MRYCCKNCGSVFNVPEGESSYRACTLDDYMECPLCRMYGDFEYYPLKAIPDFETPEQYEARTGNPWPDDAPVWAPAYGRKKGKTPGRGGKK